MKTGKLPARHDARTLSIWDIFKPHAEIDPDPQPAQDFDWSSSAPPNWGMMRNDEIGLCTCAGSAHLEQLWTLLHGGSEWTPTDDQVEDAYKAITLKVNGRAFDPTDPSTDTGLALLDVLNYWRTEGLFGRKIAAFAKVPHEDLDAIRRVGRAFGGLYTGAMLPLSAQAQVGKTWSFLAGNPDAQPGSWGGHCLALVSAAAHAGEAGGGGVKYVTWGKLQDADMGWVSAYADEMYAIVSTDWVDGTRPAPSGLDLQKLDDYLSWVAKQ